VRGLVEQEERHVALLGKVILPIARVWPPVEDAEILECLYAAQSTQPILFRGGR